MLDERNSRRCNSPPPATVSISFLLFIVVTAPAHVRGPQHVPRSDKLPRLRGNHTLSETDVDGPVDVFDLAGGADYDASALGAPRRGQGRAHLGEVGNSTSIFFRPMCGLRALDRRALPRPPRPASLQQVATGQDLSRATPGMRAQSAQRRQRTRILGRIKLTDARSRSPAGELPQLAALARHVQTMAGGGLLRDPSSGPLSVDRSPLDTGRWPDATTRTSSPCSLRRERATSRP